jgi:hypothetical protein
MIDKSPTPKLRNPRTEAKIRREVVWQIILPLSLAVILTLTLMGLIVVQRDAPVRSPLADVSVIFLIIPAALWGLVFIALIGGLCFGIFYALRELPPLFKQAQDFMVQVAIKTNTYAAKVIDGVYSVRSVSGSAERAVAKIRSAFSFLGME